MRTQGETVIGVEGLGVSGLTSTEGVCYSDPAKVSWTGLNVAEKRNAKCEKGGQTCGVGQGPCENDDGCLGDLKCWDTASKGMVVKGVEHTDKFFIKGEKLCYDSTWKGKAPVVVRKKCCTATDPCSVGEGVCTDTTCFKGLTCSPAGGKTTLPGILDAQNAAFRVCYDATAS